MRFFLIFSFVLMAGLPVHAGSRLLVENFMTSACAFSPSTNTLFETLAGRADDLLFLSCHPDYYLDEMHEEAAPEEAMNPCQRRAYDYEYGRTVSGSSSGPLVMVNGHYDAYGDYPDVVTSAVNMALAVDRMAGADLSWQDGRLRIGLPDLGAGTEEAEMKAEAGNFDLMMIVYLPVSLQDSDNGMACINPVKYMDVIGTWDGRARAVDVDVPYKKSAMLAVIAQESGQGAVRVLQTTSIPQ